MHPAAHYFAFCVNRCGNLRSIQHTIIIKARWRITQSSSKSASATGSHRKSLISVTTMLIIRLIPFYVNPQSHCIAFMERSATQRGNI
jgi:hypothetical protein